MSRTNSASPRSQHPRIASRRLRALSPLLACLLCLGLSACGASNATPEAVAGNGVPQKAVVRKGELKTVRHLVRCLRRHGFNLPEPKSAGIVNLQGFDPNAPGYRSAVSACLNRLPAHNSASTAP